MTWLANIRSVDEVAAGGKIEIRGDAESIGFNETFTLRIQARLRQKKDSVTESWRKCKNLRLCFLTAI